MSRSRSPLPCLRRLNIRVLIVEQTKKLAPPSLWRTSISPGCGMAPKKCFSNQKQFIICSDEFLVELLEIKFDGPMYMT